MLDIKFIRENKELIDLAAKKKRINFTVAELIKTDDERREIMTSIEAKRAEQNAMSVKISKLNTVPKDGNAAEVSTERASLIAQMKIVKDAATSEEEKLKTLMKNWQALMLQVPNIPDMSVPDGESDADNKEVKTWGDKKTFSFTPKDHITLMQDLNMIDLERGVKVAGFRGYILKGDAVRLCMAIWSLALEHFSNTNDSKTKAFNPIIVPSLVKKELLYGSGYLPQGADDLYKTQDDEYLAGTAEVATMGLHADEILDFNKLPYKYLAFSPCFRREAGSHGKDINGLIRVHEFYKWEQVILCEANHEQSVIYHEMLNRNTEEFIEMLGIPYHTVANCGGDLGLGQVKKYDIELWVPLEQKYREISSASYFHDFQTRRLGIRYKDGQQGQEGKMRFAHSLNSTAIPTPRILVSLIENYQQADGSIAIPEALQKYMGKSVIK